MLGVSLRSLNGCLIILILSSFINSFLFFLLLSPYSKDHRRRIRGHLQGGRNHVRARDVSGGHEGDAVQAAAGMGRYEVLGR